MTRTKHTGARADCTLSVTDLPNPARGDVTACLCVVVHGNAPLTPPARLSLAGLDEVWLRRGTGPRVALADDGHGRADLALPDPRVSSSHARLTRVHGRWLVADDGSKNGTCVNGARLAGGPPDATADPVALADGDILEVGQSILSFRDGVAHDGPALFQLPDEFPAGTVSILPAVQAAFDAVLQMAGAPLAILIEGETGTGKEVIARAIHAASARPGAFVAVNCGALPRDLLEAELFGHARGAFSGAIASRPGLVRAAHRGTLFLDEIGDLPVPAQAALLRVLQEREVRPVGEAHPVAVDLRVIAATHQPLDDMVAAGEFRADLLARLSGYRTTLPPLRERRQDLGLVLASILRALPARGGDLGAADAGAVSIRPTALRALVRYEWPANIRELEQAIASAFVLASKAEPGEPAPAPVAPARVVIDLAHLPPAIARASGATTAAPDATPAKPASAGDTGRSHPRRDEVVALLRAHRGNVAAVARATGKARMQVHRWLRRYGIDPEAFRA